MFRPAGKMENTVPDGQLRHSAADADFRPWRIQDHALTHTQSQGRFRYSPWCKETDEDQLALSRRHALASGAMVKRRTPRLPDAIVASPLRRTTIFPVRPRGLRP